MALKLTVETSDGTKVDLDAEPCTFCGGAGLMRETKSYAIRSLDDDEFDERRAIIGERCPMCLGRCLVGRVGG